MEEGRLASAEVMENRQGEGDEAEER